MNPNFPLNAFILGVSLVIVALLMRPPRYEEFPADNAASQDIHGVFDTRTGEVCYTVIYKSLAGVPEGQDRTFVNCISPA